MAEPADFFGPPTLTSDIFAPLNEFLLPHLKDLFHMCLEPEEQIQSMTLKVCNVGSKYLYFTPYKGKSITLTEHDYCNKLFISLS